MIATQNLRLIDFLTFTYLFGLSLLIVRPEYFLINYFSIAFVFVALPFLLKGYLLPRSFFLFSYLWQVIWLFFGLLFVQYVDNATTALVSHFKNVITAIIPALFITDTKRLKIGLYLIVVAGLVNLMNNIMSGSSALYTGERFLQEEEQLSLNNFAHNSFIYIVTAITLLFYEKRKWLKIFLIVVVLVGCISLMITGSRQSFVALIGFFVFFFAVKLKTLKAKHVFIFVAALLFSYFLFEWVLVEFPNSPLVRRFTDGTNEGDSQRLDFLNTTIDLFWDSPIVGYGMDTFRYFSSFVYTHSTYSEILFNGGLVYVVLFFIFYYRSFQKIGNMGFPTFENESLVLRAVIFSILVYGLFFLVHTSRLALTLTFMIINYAITFNKNGKIH